MRAACMSVWEPGGCRSEALPGKMKTLSSRVAAKGMAAPGVLAQTGTAHALGDCQYSTHLIFLCTHLSSIASEQSLLLLLEKMCMGAVLRMFSSWTVEILSETIFCVFTRTKCSNPFLLKKLSVKLTLAEFYHKWLRKLKNGKQREENFSTSEVTYTKEATE